jgi:outer membrane protein OmpA-like peptidoglycan-associated protein
MKTGNIVATTIATFMFSIAVGYGAEGDVSGSADHPLIGRYSGAKIIDYDVRQYDEASMITGKGKDDRLDLIGKVTEIYYRVPRDRSTLEVMRNYEQQLTEAGFEQLYSCGKFDCGADNAAAIHFATRVLGVKRLQLVGDFQNEQRYLVAHLPDAAGEVYVSIYDFRDAAYEGHLVNVKVVETTSMQQDQIVIDASEMAASIDETGRVSLYGIYFDTDEATMKPESASTLGEIATLLSNQPTLKLVVVGHTDNQGALDYNMDLSHRRADAVRRALIEQYSVEPDRLDAWGIGYLAPVATNKNEQGRAKNRRVELVEQ